MTSPTLKMDYCCPLKNSDLSKTKGGQFCHQCEKNIPDMRNSSKEEIIQKINAGKGDFCGTFDPLVMDHPFGDRRDKIIHWYRKVTAIKRTRFSVLMLVGFIIMSVTGCRRYTRGVPTYSVNGMPILRVHPRSIIEYADASNFVKHSIYRIHLTAKPEKKKKKIKPTNK